MCDFLMVCWWLYGGFQPVMGGTSKWVVFVNGRIPSFEMDHWGYPVMTLETPICCFECRETNFSLTTGTGPMAKIVPFRIQFETIRSLAWLPLFYHLCFLWVRFFFSKSTWTQLSNHLNIGFHDVLVLIWRLPEIEVPQSSYILIGFSLINHPLWGSPILGNPHMSWCLH